MQHTCRNSVSDIFQSAKNPAVPQVPAMSVFHSAYSHVSHLNDDTLPILVLESFVTSNAGVPAKTAAIFPCNLDPKVKSESFRNSIHLGTLQKSQSTILINFICNVAEIIFDFIFIWST